MKRLTAAITLSLVIGSGFLQNNCYAEAKVEAPINSLNNKELSVQDNVKFNEHRIVYLMTDPVIDTNGNIVAEGPATAMASGIVIGENLILTNAHVVNNVKTIKAISVKDDVPDKTYDAETIAIHPSFDLAVMKTKQSINIDPININYMNDINKGDHIITISNPKGFLNLASEGIIRGFGPRYPLTHLNNFLYKIETDKYIIFDAPASRGSSGGALINSKGELIGVISNVYLANEGEEITLDLSEIVSNFSDLSQKQGEDLYNTLSNYKFIIKGGSFEGNNNINFAIPIYEVSQWLKGIIDNN